MKIKLDKFGIKPTRAHEKDAGYDLYAPYDFVLPGISIERTPLQLHFGEVPSIKIGTVQLAIGVHIQLLPDSVGMIKSKSGLNFNQGIITEGVIDEDYTGSICVKLYNLTQEPYYFKRGDKIAQLVIMPILKPELEIVDELEETERGDGGFGSTGR